MESLHTNGELVTRTQGTGVDVVFLHGWGMNSGAFTSFIPYLSDNFRVTTIDLPGLGKMQSSSRHRITWKHWLNPL